MLVPTFTFYIIRPEWPHAGISNTTGQITYILRASRTLVSEVRSMSVSNLASTSYSAWWVPS